MQCIRDSVPNNSECGLPISFGFHKYMPPALIQQESSPQPSSTFNATLHNVSLFVSVTAPRLRFHRKMLAKLFALFAITGMVTAAAIPADVCNGQTYRCDATRYRVEVCNAAIGWTLQALCATASCAQDPAQGVPHCYD